MRATVTRALASGSESEGFEDALDRLPEEPLTPRDKPLAALEMYEEGVAMQRLALQRQRPDLDPEEIEKRLDRWLAREDEPR